MADPPKAALAPRGAVAAYFFANGALMATWVSRIPAIQQRLGLATGQLGIAYLSIAVGAMIGMPLAGAVSSRWGSRPVCGVGLVVMCLALPFISIAPDLLALSLALGFLGFAEGATDVAMNTQAVAVQRFWGRPIMPSFHALWSVGGIVGAAAGGLCAARRIPPLTHWIAASSLMAVLGAAAFLYLLKRQKPSTDAPVQNLGAHFAVPGSRVIALGTIAFCSMLGEGAMSNWSGVYLHRSLNSSQATAADGYAVFSALMSAGRFGGDALTHRFGAVKVVRAGGLLSATGFLIAVGLGSIPAALAGFALVGAGLSIIVPLALSAAGNSPGTAPGPAIASVSTIGYTGFLIGPPVIGLLADGVTLRGALVVVSVVCLLAAVLAGNTSAADGEGDTHG
jgi:MFS family permease